MEVSKDKLKIAFKIVSETSNLNLEDLLALIGGEPASVPTPTSVPKKRKSWTKEEDELLLRLKHQKFTNEEIAARLHRTKASVVQRVYEKKYTLTPHTPWTDDEVQKLQHLKSEGMTYREIADRLNRDVRSVTNKWNRIETDTKEDTTQIESFNHKQIKSFLLQHDNNLDKILSVDYTNLAKQLMMDRQKCVAMVYDVWKETSENA